MLNLRWCFGTSCMVQPAGMENIMSHGARNLRVLLWRDSFVSRTHMGPPQWQDLCLASLRQETPSPAHRHHDWIDAWAPPWSWDVHDLSERQFWSESNTLDTRWKCKLIIQVHTHRFIHHVVLRGNMSNRKQAEVDDWISAQGRSCWSICIKRSSALAERLYLGTKALGQGFEGIRRVDRALGN